MNTQVRQAVRPINAVRYRYGSETLRLELLKDAATPAAAAIQILPTVGEEIKFDGRYYQVEKRIFNYDTGYIDVFVEVSG